MSLGLDGSCLAPERKGLERESRLAASIRNTSWVRLLDKDRSEPALRTAVSWRVGPWVARGLESPLPGRTQGHAPGGGRLPRTRGSHHPHPSPLSCGLPFLGAPPALRASHPALLSKAFQKAMVPLGSPASGTLLSRASAPPNPTDMALGEGVSAVAPPPAGWGEGGAGLRWSSKDGPGL